MKKTTKTNNTNNTNVTTVRCPKCGAAFQIPAHEHAQCGVVIAKDSNMGTVYLKVDEAEQRIVPADECRQGTPLRDKHGKFLPRARWASDPAFATQENASTPDCGSLSEKVRKGGYVKNHRLFRRWIMAQLFHVLRDEKVYKGYTDRLRSYGIRYMFKVMRNEFHDMFVISKNGDSAEYNRRLRWWNPRVLETIGVDFLKQLERYIPRLKQRKCEGHPYVRLPRIGNVFTDEVEDKVLKPYNALLADAVNGFQPGQVDKFLEFCDRFKEGQKLPLRMPTTFVNAYKGNGAYFTLRNMIMFHGCFLPDKVVNEYWSGDCMSLTPMDRHLRVLDMVAERFKHDGWQLLGLLRDTIEFNHVDVAKKIESWKK